MNPANRFEPIYLERDPDEGEEGPSPQTRFYRDASRTLITQNDSPDISFTYSMNPYRGCEHGCVYCYARPTHEYLGLSAGLDFETRIFVKENAPELLREKLWSRGWKGDSVVISGVTDPYQPVEKKLGLVRRCLEVFAEFNNPVAIITKNHLVTRDIDLLSQLASKDAAAVFVSITTLDEEVRRVMEPRTSSIKGRLEAVTRLSERGVPVGVMLAPIVPGLTDHEIPALLYAAAKAGARYAGFVPLRLPYAVKDIFSDWLTRHFPDRKNKVLNQIRELRGGKLNDPNFGSRMRGFGPFADHLDEIFRIAYKKAGLSESGPRLSSAAFRRPPKPGQMELFAV